MHMEKIKYTDILHEEKIDTDLSFYLGIFIQTRSKKEK